MELTVTMKATPNRIMAYMEREHANKIHEKKLSAIRRRKKGQSGNVDTLDNLPPKVKDVSVSTGSKRSPCGVRVCVCVCVCVCG